MTTDEIIEKIRTDIESISQWVLSLEKHDEMMAELVEYHNKKFSPEKDDYHSILTEFAVADMIRCCKAMAHDATDDSWEATFVQYGVYSLFFPSHDWSTLINNPKFKEVMQSWQDGLFVNKDNYYDLMLLGFFEELGYINAAASYVRFLTIMSINMAVSDDRLSTEENTWLEILKKYCDDLEEKSTKDTVELGDPFKWLNTTSDDEEENKAIMRFSFDADMASSFKLRMMIDERRQLKAPVIFVISSTSNPYMYKILKDENEYIYGFSEGINYTNKFFDDDYCIGRLYCIDRREKPWKLYFKKYYTEDHVLEESYAPYVLGREYYGEVSVERGNITLIQAESYLNKTSFPTFAAKLVNSKIVFYDPKKKYRDMNIIANYDDPFYNYINAAIRNGQTLLASVTNDVGSTILRVKVCRKD